MKNIFVILLAFVGFSFSGYGQDEDSVICEFVTDPIPSFPGGTDSLYSFLEKNLNYPSHSLGKVFIQFNVNEDGSLSDFEIIKSTCEPCNKKVIEAFEKMPLWIPAKWDSIPMRTRMVMPVKFGYQRNFY